MRGNNTLYAKYLLIGWMGHVFLQYFISNIQFQATVYNWH